MGPRTRGIIGQMYPGRRRSRATLAVLLLSALLATFLVSSAGATAQPRGHSTKYTLQRLTKKGGWVVAYAEGFCANDWRKEALAGFNKVAAEYERQGLISKTIVTCSNGIISGQIEDINTMIAEHVNALLLIPLSSSSIAPVVTTATNDGIVTAPFNLPLTSGKFDTYDGVNLCTQATVNATQLAKWVKGQPGGIVGLGGTAGNSGTAEEWACATKVFNAAHVQTLTLQYADWEVDNAKSVMASQLAAYPHISGIWTDGGMNCQGAEEALLAAGRPLIPCAGDDYNGILKMWVKYHEKYPDFKYVGYPQPPAEEATVALTNAIDLLEGKKGVPHMETLMPPTITEANISKYVQMTLPDAVYVFGSPLTHGELLKLFS